MFKDEARMGDEAAVAADAVSAAGAKKPPKFVTQAFGLALRALALGPVSELDQLQLLQRQMGFMTRRGDRDDPEFQQLESVLYAMVCETLEPDLFTKCLALCALTSKWIMCVQLGMDPSLGEWCVGRPAGLLAGAGGR
jgi:hypothetical protein